MPLMDHQKLAIYAATQQPAYALFHEMGTGKTLTAITVAEHRYKKDQIKRVLVIAPTPIKQVWLDEIVKWASVPTQAFIADGDGWQNASMGYLEYLIVGVEALSASARIVTRAVSFLKAAPTMVIIDESSRIKNGRAIRTKRAIGLGRLANYRMILTGTPVTQGLQDLWAQFEFLSGDILKCKSFVVFRNRYCIMGGFEGRQIIGYQFTDNLLSLIKPFTSYVKRKDCMDLPPKVYETVYVQPTREQNELFTMLRQTFAAAMGDKKLTTSMVLERLTRIQQIIGGSFPYDGDDETHQVTRLPANPKLDALIEILEDLPMNQKVVIFARFRPEIAYICNEIKHKFGPHSFVEFHGGTSDPDRANAIKRFQGQSDTRFFITNKTGAYGITLTAADLVIFYSNSFSFEDRVQAEDRVHRKGLTHSVTYIDIEMNVRWDKMILTAVRGKGNLAAMVEKELRS